MKGHTIEERKRRKCPVPSDIQTHHLLVTKLALDHRATPIALNADCIKLANDLILTWKDPKYMFTVSMLGKLERFVCCKCAFKREKLQAYNTLRAKVPLSN